MAEQLFKVVFDGRLQPGQDRGDVQRRLARAFNLDEATAELLFCGKPLVRRQLDHQEARRYQQVIQQAGAVCDILPDDAIAPKPARPVTPPGVAPTARWAPSAEPPPPPPAAGPSPATMECPKCGRSQPTAAECAYCGVVVDKAH